MEYNLWFNSFCYRSFYFLFSSCTKLFLKGSVVNNTSCNMCTINMNSLDVVPIIIFNFIWFIKKTAQSSFVWDTLTRRRVGSGRPPKTLHIWSRFNNIPRRCMTEILSIWCKIQINQTLGIHCNATRGVIALVASILCVVPEGTSNDKRRKIYLIHHIYYYYIKIQSKLCNI